MNTTSENTLARALIRHDAKQVFAENFQEIHETWVSLLHQTTLPENVVYTDDRVNGAIKVLYDIITTNKNLSRLAYVRLMQVLAVLKSRVKDGRRKGLVVGKSGRRNATIAIDVFQSATGVDKRTVQKLLRRGNRWALLAEKSPLLLIMLTDEADRIINATRIPNDILRAAAREIPRVCPQELIAASDCLARNCELAAGIGPAYDPQRTQEVLIQVKSLLDGQ